MQNEVANKKEDLCLHLLVILKYVETKNAV